MTVENETHIFFLKNYLSNFHKCPTLIDPITFHKFLTTEHLFMFLKAEYFKDYAISDKILLAPTPQAAKELGRQVSNFDNDAWNLVRYEEMLFANLLKFTQNTEMKNKLIATGDKILVECNPKDPVWGIGLSENDPLILDETNWKGLNLLGKVLMEVRAKIRE